MENKNAQEIRKYMNLLETIESKIILENKTENSDEFLSEANPLVQLAKGELPGVKIIAADLKPIINAVKNDAKVGAELTRIGVETEENLFQLIKNNFKNVSPKLSGLSSAMASKVRGVVELNILKSSTSNKRLYEMCAENFVKDSRMRETYKAYGKSSDLINKLKKDGFSQQGAEAIAKKMEDFKSGKIVPGDRPNLSNPKNPKNPEYKKPTGSTLTDKVKNFTKTKGAELAKLLKSGKNWKKILAWGLALGIPSVIIYRAIKGSGEKLPEGFPTTEPVTPEVKPSEGTKKSKYTDKYEFPYRFGDRSPIIKEVQICFGFGKDWQTGNFGPNTKEFLNNLYGTSEINEDTYNRIKENCKKSSTTNTTTNTTNTPTNTTNTPTNTTNTTTNTTNTPTNIPTNTTNTPTNTDTTTNNTENLNLTKSECVDLFTEINDRDQSSAGKTASDIDIAKCKKCLQQYNFGPGQGAVKIKKRYGLTASGGDKGIR